MRTEILEAQMRRFVFLHSLPHALIPLNSKITILGDYELSTPVSSHRQSESIQIQRITHYHIAQSYAASQWANCLVGILNALTLGLTKNSQ